MTDFTTQAGRNHTNNWLKNGNFARIPRELEARSYSSPRFQETRPAMTVADAKTPEESSVAIGASPQNYYLANWSIFGSSDDCGSADVNPINNRTGIRNRSFDSGNFIRISFFQDATITLEQEIEVINQFRGMPATAAFSAYRLDGEVKIQAEIDFGSETVEGVPYFSSNIGAYRRIIQEVEECPLGLTKAVLRIKVFGRRGESLGISGAAFALGAYSLSLPYSEAMSDVLLPRGTIILWTGEACPAGFREVTPSTEGFLFQTYGDPNVLNGGTQEYPDISGQAADPNAEPIDSYDNVFAGREPDLEETLGDNEHFAHQKTNLFGETADDFLSASPDSQRRLGTVDFNDRGQPPRALDARRSAGERKASIIAAVEDYSVGFTDQANPPLPDYTSTKDIEAFKRQTVQNEVLPGGAHEERAGQEGFDQTFVWADPHLHMFKSNGVATLPPYFTVKFCEKI